MPNTLSEPKPIEEKPASTFLHEEPLLYPCVYPVDYSFDFDEESTYADSLSETEFIEEKPILQKFISIDTHPPLTRNLVHRGTIPTLSRVRSPQM
jgi:hypothetical protein